MRRATRHLLACSVGPLLLLAALLAARPGIAQAVDGSARATATDSLLLLSLYTRRVGVSTFAQQTSLVGRTALGRRQAVNYQLLNDLLYDTRGEQPFVREDYRANVLHTAALGRGWQAGQLLHYDQSRANATRTGAWLARLSYQHRLRPRNLTDTLSAARYLVFGGVAHDARNGRQDTGPTYGFDLSTLLYPGPHTSQPLAIRLFATRSQLGPRVWQRAVAESFYERAFDTFTTGALRLGYRTNRAEDYVPGNVQRIQSDTVAAQLTWAYRLGELAYFRSDNSLALPSRDFRYRQLSETADTVQNLGYNQREIDTRQEVRIGSAKVQFVTIFNYRERNRAYFLDNNRLLTASRLRAAAEREAVKDIKEQTTYWQAELTWLPSPRHSLSLLGTAQLLRVDTPSKDNEQDRDEAQHLGRLTLTSRWSGGFRTTLAVGSEYRQFVFIKASQSAENYTDRVLHWEPGFTWAPGRLSIRSTYHLWVSYQVRDRLSEQVKNRASRVLEQQQNLAFQCTPRLLASVDYVRRENRIGLLNWSEFKESPLDTTITHDLSASLKQGWAGLRGQSSIRLGYRFLEQRNQGRASLLPSDGGGSTTRLIFLHTLTRQHGPEIAFERQSRGGFSLRSSLWLQQLSTRYRYQTGQGAYAGSSYTAEELAQVTSNLYPYFEVALTWRVSGPLYFR
ncbi:hypothetical protein LJY25_05340 [Hymenobacter sp. BT175]|uniref:hypothetical protein n=1 Tax=Hymenobacter translucens TaxID=2886507 RepID=UPI001D0E44F0|nr:hypothetical protein [Hymenobacter translucens]MCC2545859.1 hypothetical protein [Hymenobacter translucens]